MISRVYTFWYNLKVPQVWRWGGGREKSPLYLYVVTFIFFFNVTYTFTENRLYFFNAILMTRNSINVTLNGNLTRLSWSPVHQDDILHY